MPSPVREEKASRSLNNCKYRTVIFILGKLLESLTGYHYHASEAASKKSAQLDDTGI